MTIQEIIESIDYCLECDNDSIPTTQDDLQTIKEALEKQMPKRLIIDNRNIHCVNYKIYMCPCCKEQIIKKIDGDFFIGKRPYHCDNCGQALDFGDLAFG